MLPPETIFHILLGIHNPYPCQEVFPSPGQLNNASLQRFVGNHSIVQEAAVFKQSSGTFIVRAGQHPASILHDGCTYLLARKQKKGPPAQEATPARNGKPAKAAQPASIYVDFRMNEYYLLPENELTIPWATRKGNELLKFSDEEVKRLLTDRIFFDVNWSRYASVSPPVGLSTPPIAPSSSSSPSMYLEASSSSSSPSYILTPSPEQLEAEYSGSMIANVMGSASSSSSSSSCSYSSSALASLSLSGSYPSYPGSISIFDPIHQHCLSQLASVQMELAKTQLLLQQAQQELAQKDMTIAEMHQASMQTVVTALSSMQAQEQHHAQESNRIRSSRLAIALEPFIQESLIQNPIPDFEGRMSFELVLPRISSILQMPADERAAAIALIPEWAHPFLPRLDRCYKSPFAPPPPIPVPVNVLAAPPPSSASSSSFKRNRDEMRTVESGMIDVDSFFAPSSANTTPLAPPPKQANLSPSAPLPVLLAASSALAHALVEDEPDHSLLRPAFVSSPLLMSASSSREVSPMAVPSEPNMDQPLHISIHPHVYGVQIVNQMEFAIYVRVVEVDLKTHAVVQLLPEALDSFVYQMGISAANRHGFIRIAPNQAIPAAIDGSRIAVILYCRPPTANDNPMCSFKIISPDFSRTN